MTNDRSTHGSRWPALLLACVVLPACAGRILGGDTGVALPDVRRQDATVSDIVTDVPQDSVIPRDVIAPTDVPVGIDRVVAVDVPPPPDGGPCVPGALAARIVV
ncbi:MAG: hypothetical protein WCJ30_04835, partial [Deltaproteobacteria bacterium]